MSITFKTWTANNGQVRIYINGVAGQHSAKIWLEQRVVDSFGCDFDVKVKSDFFNRSEAANLSGYAEQEIHKAAGFRVEKFEDALKLVK